MRNQMSSETLVEMSTEREDARPCCRLPASPLCPCPFVPMSGALGEVFHVGGCTSRVGWHAIFCGKGGKVLMKKEVEREPQHLQDLLEHLVSRPLL